MSVEQLPSSRYRDAQANLATFIAKGKSSTAFGPVDWDAPIWRDPIVKQRPASEGPQRYAFYFLTGQGGRRGSGIQAPMKQPFADFVKAAIRLHDDTSRKVWTRHAHTILVCRYLHDELAEVGYDPCRALPRHFTAAAKAISAKSTEKSAYYGGACLARVASWIDKAGIGRVRLGWKNPIAATSHNDRITVEAVSARESKMPSPAALAALPEISRQLSAPMDILRMKVVELLVCGGWRINEVLQLPWDCEVSEEVVANGKVTCRYGIRYFGSKGYGWTIKWIATPMVDVAKQAIATARELTDSVRADARWMNANPGRHPLFKDLNPDRLLTSEEVKSILGVRTADNALAWMRTAKVHVARKPTPRAPARVWVKVRDLEEGLLRQIITRNVTGLIPTHEYLFLVRTHAFNGGKTERAGSFELIHSTSIRDFISGRRTGSIFERFGAKEPGGAPIHMRTHQFRHWLNTLAQEGGMSQELIARWSGRKDSQQNAVYDHVSGAKLAEKVRVLAEAGEMVGQIARVREGLPLADREAFMKAQVPTSHVTEIGICIHDWSLVPCAIHGQCADCAEHLIDKGNAKQREEAERQVAAVEVLLQQASTEDAAGTYGASRWADAHKRRLAALNGVLAVHRDLTIADGTLVHLGIREQDQA